MNLGVPRHKVARVPEFREVTYSEKHWELLRRLREEALKIMNCLRNCGLVPLIHGSIARGDVREDSDIDVVIPYVVPPYSIELCLEKCGYHIYGRYIIKATPAHTPKGYIELDPKGLVTVSFPFGALSPREVEFYKFGGSLDAKGLASNMRVPGVSKSLILVIPTETGHKEAPVVGYESYVAKVLGISVDTVLERVRVLTKRDKYGRTGTFIKYVLLPEESFESALRRLIKTGKLSFDSLA